MVHSSCNNKQTFYLSVRLKISSRLRKESRPVSPRLNTVSRRRMTAATTDTVDPSPKRASTSRQQNRPELALKSDNLGYVTNN